MTITDYPGRTLTVVRDPEAMAAELEASGMYRVLRRFESRPRYTDAAQVPEGEPLHVATFLDFETTGLELDCKVIEFGAVQFEFDRLGNIYGVRRVLTALEDPGFPIPPDITELTGITDADVAGRKIDDTEVNALIAESDLVMSYTAEFDRQVGERRFSCLRDKPWACALRDVTWNRFGTKGRRFHRLTDLLTIVLDEFSEGHRAAEDCLIGVHLLAVPRASVPEGDLEVVSPMGILLDNVRTPTFRVYAIDSPFEAKDLLKRRGYTWCDGRGGRHKAWWIDLKEDKLPAEKAFLEAEVYRGRPGYHIAKVSRKDLFSVRV